MKTFKKPIPSLSKNNWKKIGCNKFLKLIIFKLLSDFDLIIINVFPILEELATQIII